MKNMKKSILAIATLTCMAWGCSSDNDDTRPTGIPEGSDARPTWTGPDYDLYEQTMIVDVSLQDALVQYASEQDLLCATINDEVRGVATPQQDGETVVLLRQVAPHLYHQLDPL